MIFNIEVKAADTTVFQGTSSRKTSTRLGKARPSLPQEYTMAEFISAIENPHRSWNVNTPACKWYRVECTQDDVVTRVEWSSTAVGPKLRGPLHWRQLPASLAFLSLYSNKLTGTVELGELPRNLKAFFAEVNLLDGKLNLSDLPVPIKHFYLHENNFSGALDFCNLPQQLVALLLSSNHFTGSLNLSELPLRIEDLRVSENNFEGTVNLDNLPPSLNTLHLSGNRNLKGVCRLDRIPSNLRSTSVGLFRLSYSRNVYKFRILRTQITEE